MATRVAVVGLGKMGSRHSRAYQQLRSATLTAGVDVSDEARQQFQSKFRVPAYESVSEAISALPIDAVSITTPHTTHFEQAMTALESGVSVFIEKPMTTDPNEAQQLVETARNQDASIGVGYQRRYFEPVREIKQTLAKQEIGVPQMVNCYLGQDWLSGNADSWRSDPDKSGGGLMYDTGSHLFEEILWILEAVPSQVAVVVDDREQSVDVNSSISMKVVSDDHTIVISIALCGESTDLSEDECITIWGSEGRVFYKLDPQSKSPTSLQLVRNERPTYTTTFENRSEQDVTASKLNDFISSVSTENEPRVSGETGVLLAELRAAIEEAWEQETSVNVGKRIRNKGIENPFTG